MTRIQIRTDRCKESKKSNKCDFITSRLEMAVTKRCLSCAQTGIGFLNVRPNPTAVERLQVIVQNRNERLPATGVSAEIYRRIVR